MYLGLDLGTSGVKAVLIDRAGTIVGQASAPLEVSTPHPLWSEQDPEDWWRATRSALAALGGSHDLGAIQAIGVAGQMHGAVLLSEDGRVLRPCILWNDGRSFAECAELETRVAGFRELAGNLAMPGFTAPKLVWVAKHEPDVFAAIRMVLLPKDWLVWRLTGRFTSEMSDAAGTLWLDPAARAWSDLLIEACGLTRAQLPELHEGPDVVGEVSAAVADELGLPRASVVAGAGDNAGGAVGVGVTEPGDGFVSLGTSGVIFTVSETHRACPERTVHAFCHCLPRRWHQMAVTLSAAHSLSWLAGVLGAEVGVLLDELEASGLGQTPVIFLPYLSGERTPHNDPNAKGVLFGLTGATTRAELTLAVLEGVAYSIADGLAALAAAGTTVDELAIIGGGARSARWRQILADVLDRPIVLRAGGDVGPGLGAARLARLGAGGDLSDAAIRTVCPKPDEIERALPSPDGTRRHAAKLATYRGLYPATRALMRPTPA